MNKVEFIKQIRKKYKISQKKFAEYLRISKSLIEKTEMGKSPAVPNNKYIKAISALEGLDNEIFKYDEITEEILKEYELTKFSKAFRKFLFFFYGDFWNSNIKDNIIEIILKNLEKYLYDKMSIFKVKDYNVFTKTINTFLSENNIITLYTKNNDEINLFHIFIIIELNFFKPSEFEDIEIYNEVIDNAYKFLKNILYKTENIGFTQLTKLSLDKQLLKNDLLTLEENGVPLTIENIRKLKEEKTIKETNNNLVEIKDDKDKQILELLPYAPPAFKDKIIEKLKKFKDEVENL